MSLKQKNINKINSLLVSLDTHDDALIINYLRAVVADLYKELNISKKKSFKINYLRQGQINDLIFIKNLISGENHLENPRSYSMGTILRNFEVFIEHYNLISDEKIEINFPKREQIEINWSESHDVSKRGKYYINNCTYDHAYNLYCYQVFEHYFNEDKHPTKRNKSHYFYSKYNNLSSRTSYWFATKTHTLYDSSGNEIISINYISGTPKINIYNGEIENDEFRLLANEIAVKYNYNPFEIIKILITEKDLDKEEIKILENFSSYIEDIYSSEERKHHWKLSNVYKHIVYFKHFHPSLSDILNNDKMSPLSNEFWTKESQSKAISYYDKKIIMELLLNKGISFQNNHLYLENKNFGLKLFENDIVFLEYNGDIEKDFPENDMFYEDYNEYKVVEFSDKKSKNFLTFRFIKDLIDLFNNLFSKEKIDVDFSKKNYDIWNSFELDNTQINIIKKTLNNRISIIEGKAGTGKSTIAMTLYKSFSDFDEKTLFLSPTLKSSVIFSILSDEIKEEILLENPTSITVQKFIFNYENYLDIDNIIIDEITMISTVDWEDLLNIIKTTNFKRIIFIGDPKQIGPINSLPFYKYIFNIDIVNHEILKLQKPHRHSKKIDNIYNNVINKIREEKRIIGCDSIIKTYSTLFDFIELVKNIEERDEEYRYITPINNSIFGVRDLNFIISGKGVEGSLDIGDNVIVNKTHSDSMIRKYIFNGNEFSILEIAGDLYKTSIKTKWISKEFLFTEFRTDSLGYLWFQEDYINDGEDNITLSKVLTTHKSQGGTFEYVAVIIPPGNKINMRLLYTAVSRVKKELIIIVHKNEREIYHISKG